MNSPQWLRRLFLWAHGDDIQISRSVRIYGDEANIELSDHVRIDDFTVLVATGKIEIGRYVHIAHHCTLHGGGSISINNFSTLSDGVQVWSVSDDFSGAYMGSAIVPDGYRRPKAEQVIIGKHCIIGAGTIILPGAVIPDGVAIGANSVVNRTLGSWSIYAGSPVRFIKERRKDCRELAGALMIRDRDRDRQTSFM